MEFLLVLAGAGGSYNFPNPVLPKPSINLGSDSVDSRRNFNRNSTPNLVSVHGSDLRKFVEDFSKLTRSVRGAMNNPRHLKGMAKFENFKFCFTLIEADIIDTILTKIIEIEQQQNLSQITENQLNFIFYD
ncbi:MAG: hypothetical protein MHPSP_001983, partial [Paramarteilia canceri]